jgi:hypothetical protein
MRTHVRFARMKSHAFPMEIDLARSKAVYDDTLA